MFNKHLPLLHGNVSILPEVPFFLPADAGNCAVQRRIFRNKRVCLPKNSCSWAASSPSQSSLRDASSPKVGALGSPRKVHLFAKASPFGRGVTAGDGEGEPAKEKASATTIRRLSEIQKRLLQMLLLYTILRHAKGTYARNITLRPSGHPDARAVCVSMRRTVAAMQSTGCRQKHRQKRHRPSIHGKTR